MNKLSFHYNLPMQAGGIHDYITFLLSRYPLCLPSAAMAYCLEHQLHATGNSQLVENSVQKEAELFGDFAVAETIGDEGNYRLFARCQKLHSQGIYHAQRRYLGDRFNSDLGNLAHTDRGRRRLPMARCSLRSRIRNAGAGSHSCPRIQIKFWHSARAS